MVATGSPDDVSRETLARLQQLSNLMDRAFVIPGTGIRFGLDSVVGLIPVIGDTATVAVSGYIYSFAKKAGVPRRKRLRMAWNIFIDWLIGLVPVLGDAFDVAFKANSKNVQIIMAHVENQLDADNIERPHERVA
ncbi:DUF4112 domain-containing protein [Wenzhouxiangella sp. EGI_FJ10409]|uniref:DUF4112 domain-containing protein n=1 Tax=Wenzhouxiangella sp. EGI_FJ10409 TaxID=3243767 RepID=UPI0035E01787